MYTSLDSKVYIRMPPEYGERGKIYRLNKAVYGLRKAPLLWQRMFTSTLLEIGFTPIPHEPCCFTCNGVLIFFYVADIVIAYRNESLARDLMSQLKRRYNLSGGEDLQWFLGFEVHRDRSKRLIWLNQSRYIDKIVKLSDTNQPDDRD